MKPKTEHATGDGGGVSETNSEFNTWRALQRATDKKRADIIADIVGHPLGAPSVEELDYMNPPLSEDSIRRHLNTLAGVGVVRVLEFEPGERIRGYPYQFFELTPEARKLFDRNGLFPEEAWQRQYAAVKKTNRIKELESMPRPDA
ncbi:ArsR family transcriptional regulator [Halogeometricum borinquense]|uniref:ArsR family transcriptional regulator n=1 Tax=Halogeometricum borinquense TaxID=60847 RepID=A0A6C0UDS4_9EURY|nr:ArsR family transcriptional regulator [Halogeometricum borinquense]QIB73532.1 ArsR family transcriptional regulator [Halogeometricum borinquense]